MDRSNDRQYNHHVEEDDSNSNTREMAVVVVEDSPQLRSMAIGGAVGPAPVMLVSPRFPTVKQQQPFLPTQTSSSTPIPTTASSSSCKGWLNVRVEPIPAYYCLERTHATITDCTVEMLGQRIVNCFRMASIAATFSGNEATAETSDCVSFSVRLWSSSSSSSDRNDDPKTTIVVEIQRLCGCSYVYQQMARRILRAAANKEEEETTTSNDTETTTTTASMNQNSFKLPSCLPHETPKERENCMKEGLEIAECLLQQNKLDSQLMAFESLVKLSSTCCSAARLYAAQSILLSSNSSFVTPLMNVIQFHRINHDPTSSSHHQESMTEMEEEHSKTLRRHALHILANCLSTLADDASCDLDKSSFDCTDTLLTVLVQDVTQSDIKPHEACHALRCFQALCRYNKNDKTLSHRIHTALYTMNADKNLNMDVVGAAQSFGMHRHSQLHEQATILKRQLLQQQQQLLLHRDS